jgi:fluoroquinolone resistance protein
MDGTTHHPIAREELSAHLAGDRVFSGLLFATDIALDELDLTESRFERCLFQAPSVRGADFSGAAFSDCTFEPMRMASCKLVKTRLSGCSAFDAGKRKGCTFAFCDMHGAEIIKCNFATGRFERCDLYDLNAVDSSFRGVNFHQSTFTKAISRRSVLTKATFDGCNLSFADLSGLVLENCEFRSCKFSEASFIDTDLSHATMLACALDRAEWDRATLRQADLRGSSLSGLNLAVLADYAGVKISDSEQAEILKQLGVDVCVS